MSSEAWVGILAILVGVLTTAVGALIIFLFNIAIKVNTIEQHQNNNRQQLNDFKAGIAELREYLFSRGRKRHHQPEPDSDEAGEQPQANDW